MALAASGAKSAGPAKAPAAGQNQSNETLAYDYLDATSPGRSLLGMSSLPKTSFGLTSGVLDVLAHFASPTSHDPNA
jgi:hypothetical protein